MSADPNLACGVLDSLGRFWLDMCFTDLVVTVDQIPFHCHKFHLCACSAFFNTLLNTENADGSKNSINHVIITGISPATFENILRAIYKGENVLDENNMIPLWYAALQLKVNVLVPKCEEFIISRLTLKNYENLYLYAILVGSNRVVNSVLEFMANNFEHFRQTSTFLDLPTDHLKVIVDKLASMPLSRDTIVSPILLWASHITADDDGNVGQRRWDLLSYVPTKYKEGKFSVRSTETGTIGTENVTESAEAKSEADAEVTFTKPPLPITEESSKQELREVFRLYPNQNRCHCLGDLLQNVQLERASADYLKSLTNDDWLMSIKEARDVVWNAVVAQKCLEGNAAAKNGNTSSVPSDLPHVKCAMVYKALPENDGPYAYRLDTDKLYRAPSPAGTFETIVGGYSRPLSVLSFYTTKTDTYSGSTYKVYDGCVWCSGLRYESANYAIPLQNGFCPVYHDGFFYCFQGNLIFRARPRRFPIDFKVQSVWSNVGKVYSSGKPQFSVIFHGNMYVFFIRTRRVPDSSSSYRDAHDLTVGCFNLTTHWCISKESTIDNVCAENIVTLIYNDNLYILLQSAQLYRLDHPTQKDIKFTPFYKQCHDGGEYDKEMKLWRGCCCIRGAVVYRSELVVFVDTSNCTSLPEPNVVPLDLRNVRFVPILSNQKCFVTYEDVDTFTEI